MAIASILLAIVAIVCLGAGLILTPFPTIGAVFSFAAPLLALLGITFGGLAMSRAKRANEPQDMGRAGVILGFVAFLPALLVALTCGVCNALCSSGGVKTQKGFQFQIGTPPQVRADAGPGTAPPPPPMPGSDDPAPGNGRPTAADGGPAQGLAPPPAWPPPPMPAPDP